jgi:hypothetical protein
VAMAAARSDGVTSAAAEATVMMLMTGGVAMSKSTCRSRSGLEQEIQTEWAVGLDLGQNDGQIWARPALLSQTWAGMAGP